MSPFLQTMEEVAASTVPFCTSTPRKSRIYYDKRRLIDYYNGVSSATSSDEQNVQRLQENHNQHYHHQQQEQQQQQNAVNATSKDYNIIANVRPKKSLILQRLRHLSASSSSSASSAKCSPQMRRILQNYGNGNRGGGKTLMKEKNSKDTSNKNLQKYSSPRAAIYDVMTIDTSRNHNQYQQRRQPAPLSSSSSLSRKRLGRRLSLHFDGKFFLNCNRSRRMNTKRNQQILYENKRKKLQNVRCTYYDQYRDLDDLVDYNENDNDDDDDVVKCETVDGVDIDNATFDIKNNNYKFVNQNNPVSSSSSSSSTSSIKYEDMGNTMVIDHQDIITLSPSLSSIAMDNPPPLVLANTFDVINPICDSVNILCNTTNQNVELFDCTPNNLRHIKEFEQMIVKPKESSLLYDRIYNGKRWWRPRRYRNIIINDNHKHTNSLDDDDDNDDNSRGGDGDNDDKDFEELCKNIDSNAPFALEPLHYDYDDIIDNADDDADDDDDNEIFDEKLNTSFIDSKKHIETYTYLTLLSNSSELSAITNLNFDTAHNTILSNNISTMSTTATTTAASGATKTTLLSSCLSLNNSSKSIASTTIYPQTNIFDHRLPNISTMHINDKKDSGHEQQQQQQQQKGFNATNGSSIFSGCPRHFLVYFSIGILLILFIYWKNI